MGIVQWKRWPLAVRLTVATTSIVMLAVLVVTSLSVRRERRNFQQELQQQAVLLLDTIAAGSADSLYFLDADYLSDLMLDLGQNGVVTSGRIYDAEGRVVADALDGNARFNLAPDPYGFRLLTADAPVFTWQEAELIAGQPVRLGAETVGAVSVGLPTAPLAEKVRAVRVQGVTAAVVGVLTGLVLALVLSHSITEPLQEMIAATKLVGEGDLSQQVTIRSGDELATLGNRFNEMTGRLAEAMQAQEQQIAELDAFSHTVAHDLKNPLGFIAGLSELMIAHWEDGDPVQFRTYLQKMNESSLRAADIVDELLLLASVRQQDVLIAPVEMDRIVANALERLAPQIAASGGEIILSDSWPQACGYGPWVEEVWVNYLSNGLKYGGDPPRLVLGGELRETGTARFWVRDNGQGVVPEDQEILFTEFARLSEVQVEGYGLGLSIVQRIVHKLGGEVGVNSSPGAGSEFYFELPVCRAARRGEQTNGEQL